MKTLSDCMCRMSMSRILQFAMIAAMMMLASACTNTFPSNNAAEYTYSHTPVPTAEYPLYMTVGQ